MLYFYHRNESMYSDEYNNEEMNEEYSQENNQSNSGGKTTCTKK